MEGEGFRKFKIISPNSESCNLVVKRSLFIWMWEYSTGTRTGGFKKFKLFNLLSQENKENNF